MRLADCDAAAEPTVEGAKEGTAAEGNMWSQAVGNTEQEAKDVAGVVRSAEGAALDVMTPSLEA